MKNAQIIIETFVFLLTRYDKENKGFVENFILNNKEVFKNLYNIENLKNCAFVIENQQAICSILEFFHKNQIPIYESEEKNFFSFLSNNLIVNKILDGNDIKHLEKCLVIEPNLIKAKYNKTLNNKHILVSEITKISFIVNCIEKNNELLDYFNNYKKEFANVIFKTCLLERFSIDAQSKFLQSITLKDYLDIDLNQFKRTLLRLNALVKEGFVDFIKNDEDYFLKVLKENFLINIIEFSSLNRFKDITNDLELIEKLTDGFFSNINTYLEKSNKECSFLSSLIGEKTNNLCGDDIVENNVIELINYYCLKNFNNKKPKKIIFDNSSKIKLILLQSIMKQNEFYKNGSLSHNPSNSKLRIDNIIKLLNFIYLENDDLKNFKKELKETLNIKSEMNEHYEKFDMLFNKINLDFNLKNGKGKKIKI